MIQLCSGQAGEKEKGQAKKIEWMQKARKHYSKQYDYRYTDEDSWIIDRTIGEFDAEDQATLRFLDKKSTQILAGLTTHRFEPVLMFGLIELISAYEAEGYSKEEFLERTEIEEMEYDLARCLMR